MGLSSSVGIRDASPARKALGVLAALTSLGVLTRCLTNKSMSELFGYRGPIHVKKTIEVAAPLSQVFHKIHEKLGAMNDVRVARFHENEFIYWKSKSSARVENFGSIYFRAGSQERQTRIEVDVAYRPLMGWLGHGMLKLIRRDPKRTLDQAFMEMKAELERSRVAPSVPTVFEAKKQLIG
ncbi:hypothetical protein EBZ37_14385 [bacterium]|nr:hypothetical protein [bacterium]